MNPEEQWKEFESVFKKDKAYKLSEEGKIIPPDVLLLICKLAFLNGVTAERNRT